MPDETKLTTEVKYKDEFDEVKDTKEMHFGAGSNARLWEKKGK